MSCYIKRQQMHRIQKQKRVFFVANFRDEFIVHLGRGGISLKTEYLSPEIEIFDFELEDIITSSPGMGYGGGFE